MQNGYRNGYTNGSTSGAAPVTVLLVEADGPRADRMARHLEGALPGLVATRCESLASARAYLVGTTFDAVYAAEELPDGAATTLLILRDTLGLRAPVFVRAQNGVAAGEPDAASGCFMLHGLDEAAAAAAIGRALGAVGATKGVEDEASADGLLTDATGLSGRAPGAASPGEASVLLEALRAETGAVAHAINNPLTVIAGNAQLLGELARTGGLDPMVQRPIEDIESAVQQLGEVLGRLGTLRERIAVALGVADRI